MASAYNIVTDSYKEIDRKAYQAQYREERFDAAVRYVTVLFPTTDAAAQSVEINTGEWSETGASISVRSTARPITSLYAVNLKTAKRI